MWKAQKVDSITTNICTLNFPHTLSHIHTATVHIPHTFQIEFRAAWLDQKLISMRNNSQYKPSICRMICTVHTSHAHAHIVASPPWYFEFLFLLGFLSAAGSGFLYSCFPFAMQAVCVQLCTQFTVDSNRHNVA